MPDPVRVLVAFAPPSEGGGRPFILSDEDFLRRAGCDVRSAGSLAENLAIARSGWPQVVVRGMLMGSPLDIDDAGVFHGRGNGFRRGQLEAIGALGGAPLADPFAPPVTGFVDDDKAVARIADVILQSAGIASTVFTSHRELVEACALRPFDTIVVHTRADTEWLDAAAAVRRLPGYERARLGLSTGMAVDAPMQDALSMGVLDFILEKPFTAEALVGAVRGEDASSRLGGRPR